MAPTTIFLAFTLWTLGIWIRRAVLMMGSIKKYSLIPDRAWQPGAAADKVSVIIPCRNEEHNVDTVIPSLLRQDYPALEFVFLDDRSTDKTLDRLRFYAALDKRVKVLEGKPLPEGWTGKNHAMHQCAQAAAGKWLLFTDADTLHEPHSVSSSVRYAQERGLDLLTLSARCVCKSFSEHLVQPMGIGCFSVWFKLEEVNDPNSKVPLACGQYLMVKKDVYEAEGGSERVKDAVTEDLEFFKVLKEHGRRCELAIGAHLFATRMYRNFKESWIGWRRIYLHGLQKDIPSIVRKMLMLVFYSFLPFAIFGYGLWRVYGLGDASWNAVTLASGALCGFILFLRSRSHAALKTAQWSIILHPLSALVIIGILADCLLHHFSGRKVQWKSQRY